MLESLAKLWRTPTARELALRELEEAKREKLSAETARDYANALVIYNTVRIERLTNYHELTPTTDKNTD